MEYDIAFITVAVFAMVGIAAFSTVATNEPFNRMVFGLASKHPSHGGVEPHCFAAYPGQLVNQEFADLERSG